MPDFAYNIAEDALEAAGVGGWDLNVVTGALAWTPVTYLIHELDPGQPPPPLEAALGFYPPDARPRIEAAVQQGIHGGKPWDLELPFVTAHGRSIWVRACGRAIRERGQTVRLFGAFEDITARRELSEREARLSMVALQMTNVVMIVGLDGRVEWVNDAFTRLTGYAAEEIHGRFPGDLLNGPDTDPAAIRHIADSVRAGRSYEEEILNYAKDGRTLWMSVIGTPTHDARGAHTGFISVETDVTARRAAEETARLEAAERTRAEALLRDVLEALPCAVTAYDPDERFILANRAYAEMFPLAAAAAVPGKRYADVMREAAAQGQYPDAGATPETREAWISRQLAHHRAPSGARTLTLPDGRVLQAVERRSHSGNVVCVRMDTTDLKRAEDLLRDVLDALPNAVTAYDRDERFILSNRAYDEMFPVTANFAVPGRTREEVLRLAAEHGQFADSGSTPAARAAWVARHLHHHRNPGAVRSILLADGRSMDAVDRRSESGNVVSVRTDTTELKRAEALLRDVLEAIPNAVIAYDSQERLTVWNRAAVEMMPVAARFATPGIRLEDMVRLSAEHGQFPEADLPAAAREAWVAGQIAAYRAAAGPRTVRLPGGRFAQAREQRSNNGHLVCVRTDTTELMRAHADLRIQAERDPLTLLANRATFFAALDLALATHGADKPPGGALVLLDIDYFKQINDTLGHDIGDALLVEIANRLRAQLRPEDLAARLGGDEFGVVIPGLVDPRGAAARLDAMHAELAAPVGIAGRRQLIGISIGVTLFPADGRDATSLLKNADLALYEAKRNGRDRWSAFRAEQAEALLHHSRIADALRSALLQNAVTISLQPKRFLSGGHAGFEALARWHDGNRWVPPSDFIPVAEDTGMIVPLGRAVIDAALARLRALRDHGQEPGRVAVNVTGPQLLDSQFMAETLKALSRYGLQPTDLELELTETLLFGRAAERIEAVLRDFSRLGITLALDDFGTGYASLAHLSRLPIDRLKIDQSFVAGIGQGGPGGVIARTVVSLAQSLGMQSVAEGVETPEQLAFLRAAGCDVGQGYLISRPLLTTAEALEYLRADARVNAGPVAAGYR